MEEFDPSWHRICGAFGRCQLSADLTPIVGAAAAFGNLAVGVSSMMTSEIYSHDRATAAFELGVMSIALVLLGPAQFSLDGQLFGHREIIILDATESSRFEK